MSSNPVCIWKNGLGDKSWITFSLSISFINNYKNWVPLAELFVPVFVQDTASTTVRSKDDQRTTTYSTTFVITHEFSTSLSAEMNFLFALLRAQAEKKLSVSDSHAVTYSRSIGESTTYSVHANSKEDYGVYNLIYGFYGGKVYEYHLTGVRYRTTIYNGQEGSVNVDPTYHFDVSKRFSACDNDTRYSLESVHFPDYRAYYSWLESYPNMNYSNMS